MQLRRNEILTGLLVLGTVAVLTFILIMLGAPGLFRPLVIYKLYFDNAAGIKLGAPVLLAGRKVGQVKSLNSPVSREEAAGALEAAGNLGTVTGLGGTGLASLPRFEVRIDIEVDRTALVYKNANVRLDDPWVCWARRPSISLAATITPAKRKPGRSSLGPACQTSPRQSPNCSASWGPLRPKRPRP